jgi:hypothetical protein
MADDDDSNVWGRVVVLLVGLVVVFLLVGLVLKLLKWAIYAALIIAAVAVISRATRSGRR